MKNWLKIVVFLYSSLLFGQDNCHVVVSDSESKESFARLKAMLPQAQVSQARLEKDFNSDAGKEQYGEYLEAGKYIYTENKLFIALLSGQYQALDVPSKPRTLSCAALNKRRAEYVRLKSLVFNTVKHIHLQSEEKLGPLVLALEHNYLSKKYKKSPFDLVKITEQYNDLLARIKEVAAGIDDPRLLFSQWVRVKEIIYSNHSFNLDYCGKKVLMAQAFTQGCTNCVGETLLFLSLFKDGGFKLPPGWHLSAQLFRNHVAAVLYSDKDQNVYDLINGSLKKQAGAIIPWNQLLIGTLTHSVPNFMIAKNFVPKIEYYYKPLLCIFSSHGGQKDRDQLVDFSPFYSCGKSNGDAPEHSDNESRIHDSSHNQKKSSLLSQLKGRLGGFMGRGEGSLRINAQENFSQYLNESERAMVDEFEKASVSRKKEIVQYFSIDKFAQSLGIKKGLFAEDEKFFADSRKLEAIYAVIGVKRTSEGVITIEASGFGRTDVWTVLDQSQKNFERLLAMGQSERFRYLVNDIEDKLLSYDRIFKMTHDKSAFQTIVESHREIISYVEALHFLGYLIDFLSYTRGFNVLKYLKSASMLAKHNKDYVELLSYMESHVELTFFQLNDYLQKGGPQEIFKYINLLDRVNGRHSHFIDDNKFASFLYYNLFFNMKYFFTAEPTEEEREKFEHEQRPFDPISLKVLAQRTARGEDTHLTKITLPRLNHRKCKHGDRGLVVRNGFYIECFAEENSGDHGKDDNSHDGSQTSIPQGEEGLISDDVQLGYLEGFDNTGAFTKQKVEVEHMEIRPVETAKEIVNLSHEGAAHRIVDPRQEVHLSTSMWDFLLIHTKHYINNFYSKLALHHAQRDKMIPFIKKHFGEFHLSLYQNEAPKYNIEKIRIALAAEKGKSSDDQFRFLFRYLSERDSEQVSLVETMPFYNALLSDVKVGLKKGWFSNGKACGFAIRDGHYRLCSSNARELKENLLKGFTSDAFKNPYDIFNTLYQGYYNSYEYRYLTNYLEKKMGD